jgi:hypothetical protein
MLRFLSIVLLCIAASIAYGLVHDQITIRISLEYFTVLHPQILPEDTSPTVLALAWGIIATWWVGLILGIILGLACCVGKQPSLGAKDLLVPIIGLLGVMAVGAALAGIIGYELGVHKILTPAPFVTANVASDRINRLFTAGGSHLASYAIGFAGGIVLSIRSWIRRGKLAKEES